MLEILTLANEFKDFEIVKTGRVLANLSKFNIFIGPNNSGKSRFLRTLFKNSSNSLSYLKGEGRTIVLNNVSLLPDFFNDYFIVNASANHLFYNKQDAFWDLAEKVKKISTTNRDYFSLFSFYQLCYNLSEKDYEGNRDHYQHFNMTQRQTLVNSFKFITDRLQHLPKDYKFLYIPVLRGLRPINLNNVYEFTNNDAYLYRTTYDYFEKKKPNTGIDIERFKNSIFSGLSLYEDVKELLLGDEDQRGTIAEFEDFISEIIFKEKVTLIPKYKDDVLHIKIGSSPQLEVYNLGDGIQALITLLFPIFIRRNENALIFIEEPEIHLHPSWQRRLINALNQFENHQYFFTTHSSTFLNIPNASIFKVKTQVDTTYISYLNLRDEKIEVLNDVGYKASDLLQTNFLLWVEGPSDAIYINYWIEKLSPELQEGLHYTIMFYGGANINTLLKADKLSIFGDINLNYGIYLDSDRCQEGYAIPAEKQKIVEIFEKNARYCWISNKREIENYISFETFEQAVTFIHPDSNPQIEEGDYVKRTRIIDLNSNNTPKSKIKLPDNFMQKVQRNKGDISSVDASEIKQIVQEALNESTVKTFEIAKLEVAKKVVELAPSIEDEELQEKIKELITQIKKANSI